MGCPWNPVRGLTRAGSACSWLEGSSQPSPHGAALAPNTPWSPIRLSKRLS